LHFARAGHYAEWDENHPIHLVGHSSGVQVARHLQHMLAEKVSNFYYFQSDNSSSHCVSTVPV
jgi:hypothetical protein